ncbi:MAG: L,D-transpeptidase [Bacteroidales bacterium]
MKNELTDSSIPDKELEDISISTEKDITNRDFKEFITQIWQKWLKKLTFFLAITCFIVVGLFWLLLYFIPYIQEMSFVLIPETHKEYITADSKAFDKFKDNLIKNTVKLQRKLDYSTPNSSYMVINTTENTFHLYSGKRLVRKGSCSTGSYTLLQASDDKQWIFKTPRGVKHIHGKTTSPVWKKPDWAFIEEGLPVPPPNDNSRFEYGTLGDYALSIGNGYLIHGTLYQRLLGLPVTHGCVRLNDKDLESVYHTLSIGSKVYIY